MRPALERGRAGRRAGAVPIGTVLALLAAPAAACPLAEPASAAFDAVASVVVGRVVETRPPSRALRRLLDATTGERAPERILAGTIELAEARVLEGRTPPTLRDGVLTVHWSGTAHMSTNGSDSAAVIARRTGVVSLGIAGAWAPFTEPDARADEAWLVSGCADARPSRRTPPTPHRSTPLRASTAGRR